MLTIRDIIEQVKSAVEVQDLVFEDLVYTDIGPSGADILESLSREAEIDLIGPR